MDLRRLQCVLVLFACLSLTGCRFLARDDCSQIDTSLADAQPEIDPSQNIGYVSSCYDGVTDLESSPPFSPDQFLQGQSLALELEQCCCIAAINSPLADVIDKERKAACCTIGYNGCLDRFLKGQSLQQRNKAAGNAGELFLRLVEIHLQKDLVRRSFEKLEELKEASHFAADQGFATDEADKELAANEISLNRKLLSIEKNELEIVVKLSAILGIEKNCLKIIEPIFDLLPIYEEVSIEQESSRAFNERPDLQSFGNQCGGVDPECFMLLAQLDPRLGIGLISQIKKCILLQRLKARSEPAKEIRQQQLEKLKSLRQQLVRVEVADAVFAIESGYRELVLDNEDLNRLQTRLEALEVAADLDPQENYVESVQNWGEQQSVRSQRITSAINFEIAKIKLLTATGRWVQICGFDNSHSSCDCSD